MEHYRLVLPWVKAKEIIRSYENNYEDLILDLKLIHHKNSILIAPKILHSKSVFFKVH